MTSSYTRGNYSPYSKANNQPNEQLPLRSKAFSHLDNITPTYPQHQNAGGMANQDKIAEIKKKYEKILSISSKKSNEENGGGSATKVDYNRSVSTFQNYDENTRYSPYNKSYQTPTTTKDRRPAEYLEIGEQKNISSKPQALRDYVHPSRTEVKSHLESNRMTLDAMKSQLQSKLKDLSAKANVPSSLRNPSAQTRQNDRKDKEEGANSYEAILTKYSNNITQHRHKAETSNTSQYKYEERETTNTYQRRENNAYERRERETLESKVKDTSQSNYIPKYTAPAKNIPVASTEKTAKTKQLSIISEISNSNHSEEPKNPYEPEDKETKNRINEKIRQIQQKYKNTESNIIIQKPISYENKYQERNWFKNTTSYLDANEKKDIKEESNGEFTLKKLQNSEGFSVKRTVTEENFMNLNKLNLIQARFQQKQKSTNANASRVPQHAKADPVKKEVPRYEPTKNAEVRDPTPNSRNTDKSAIKYTNKSIEDEKSEIQKLKEKYNINSSQKYSNPYREQNHERSVTAEKTEKSEKSQPRNNQVISKEIEKLDQKIKQIQQNKKELNINFRPYEVSKSIPKPTATVEPHKVSVSNYERVELPSKYNDITIPSNSSNAPVNIPLSNMTPASTHDKNKYNVRYQAYLDRVKPIYSEITLPQASKPQASGFSIKLLPVQVNNNDESQTERSVSEISSKSRVNDYMNKVQMENRTDNGIEQRKKKLQEKMETTNTIKNLVKAFGQQAVYDECFRNNKIWFASEYKDKKWSQLKNQLNQISINMSESQLKEAFNLQESENNPFFSVSDNKCNMKSLAQSYKVAQKHWEQKLMHKFNKTELERQGLNSGKLDADKKGYIEVEDFVRFLNLESGTFLRNRDISIIYKRMCNGESKLQFEQFVRIISS